MSVEDAVRSFKKEHPLRRVLCYWERENGYILYVEGIVRRANKCYFADDTSFRLASDEEVIEVSTIPMTIYDDVEVHFKQEILVGGAAIILLLAFLTIIMLWRKLNVWQVLYQWKFMITWVLLCFTGSFIDGSRKLKGKTVPAFFVHFNKHSHLYWIIALFLDGFFDMFLEWASAGV